MTLKGQGGTMPTSRELVHKYARPLDEAASDDWEVADPMDTCKRIMDIIQKTRGENTIAARESGFAVVKEHNVGQRQSNKAIRALFDWITKWSSRHFINDPVGIETIAYFPQILWMMDNYGVVGDCDDHLILMGILSLSIGIPVRLIVAGKKSTDFSHVYLKLLANPKDPCSEASWMSFDPTPRTDGTHNPLGWEFAWEKPYYKEWEIY